MNAKDKAMLLDMLSAFGAGVFGWDSHMGFHINRSHSTGSMGWERHFTHCWSVPAHHQTRDKMIREGLIEAIPFEIRTFGGEYRLASKVWTSALDGNDLDTLRSLENPAPSKAAFRAHLAAEEKIRKEQPTRSY